MTKGMKKLISLLLIVALSVGLLSACGEDKKPKVKYSLAAVNTTDQMTLTYTYWEDELIVDELAKKFMEKYPNIKVEHTMFGVAESTSELIARAAAKNLPDAFWVLGSCDFAIENGMLFDMTKIWEADEDAQKLIPGVNELKLGYFGTDYKWTTPVKYFPSAAFVNKQLFEDEGKDMPKMDWSWEEFEEIVEEMTYVNKDGNQLFGITEGITVITWYPIASDKECVGEFGWNGKEFDLTNWAYGLNLEGRWIRDGYKGPTDFAELLAIYGVETFAQDLGFSAMQTDLWWTWERFWITSSYIDNNIIFVPYQMPHTEEVKEQGGGNHIATMDFGGISSLTQRPREAYELLKFMTWGQDGWKAKLEIYPNLFDETNQRNVEKNNMPLCNDEDIWDGFRAWHPGSDDEFGRGEYFDYYLDVCREGTWTCYGGQQIPGFGTWLEDNYFNTYNVEQEVILNNKDAQDYVADLTRLANESNQQRLDEINALLVQE